MRFSTVLTALKAAPRLGSTHFPPWVFLASHFRVENVHVQKTGPHAVQLLRKMPFLSFTPLCREAECFIASVLCGGSSLGPSVERRRWSR